VESIPGKVSGAWVFKGTRMPVSLVFENLEAGAKIDEIMDWFHLTREQIVAVLQRSRSPGHRRSMLVLFDHSAWGAIALLRHWPTAGLGFSGVIATPARSPATSSG
jgi:uncharacterized protein (DUF433 family)